MHMTCTTLHVQHVHVHVHAHATCTCRMHMHNMRMHMHMVCMLYDMYVCRPSELLRDGLRHVYVYVCACGLLCARLCLR